MKVISSTIAMEAEIAKFKKKGLTIGFVPTMGALHEGHISLIQLAKKKCDVVVCSIFVNPTQFNNAEDLKKYPRTLIADIKKVKPTGLDVVFAPIVEDIYPTGLDTNVYIDLGNLDSVMEGKFRPGHFKGMIQVVKRLLDIVQPLKLCMGQKDFQQFTIVKHMIHALKLPVELIVGKTLREKDGLAMSSRNVRLTSEYRKKAPIIFKTMKWVKQNKYNDTVSNLKKEAIIRLKNAGLKPEYVEIVHADSLTKIRSYQESTYAVICIATWAGDVRLIDNLIL